MEAEKGLVEKGVFPKSQGHSEVLREGEMSSMPLEGQVQDTNPLPSLERDAFRGAGLGCRFLSFRGHSKNG